MAPTVGSWVEVPAVEASYRHAGQGRRAYDLVVDHVRTIERDGDHLAGLVHRDNDRSKRLLGAVGWALISPSEDYELWMGAL